MAKDIQQISKGLNKDINQEFQPEATYRFMLNGMLETLTGEKAGIMNERGNIIILATPSGITSPNVIGDCLLPSQDKVLFITGNDGTQEVQIIGLHKKNNTYVELIRTNCLEYTKCEQIDCIFKIHNGCDVIIYFTDHKNRYKSINITSIENNTGRYQDPTHVGDPNVPIAGQYGWDCDSFFLSPAASYPNMYYHKEGNSGNLRTGAYTFFIRLLDRDLNPTDWIVHTNPIFVKQGGFNFNSPPDNNDGFYIDVTTEKFVNKSISLVLENLDETFQYYEIGILERSLNTGLPSYAYRSGQRLITSSTHIFLFNDVSDSRFVDITAASLLVDTLKIDVVQAHTQINNRLVLGNITGSTRDWSAFQKSSNNIQVEYFTYNNASISDNGCGAKHHVICSGKHALNYEITNNAFTPSTAIGMNFSSPDFLSYGMSLMRDEVYALGIIYVFNDGSESPVFHIPGRMKYSNTPVAGESLDSDIIDGFDYADYAINRIQTLSHVTDDVKDGAVFSTINVLDDVTLDLVAHNDRGSWESDRLTNLPQDNTLANVTTDEYKYLYGFRDHITCCYEVPFTRNSCNDNELKRWQYYNTALRRKSTSGVNSWNSVDDKSILSGSNPTYTFEGGFRGVPGYFDTGIDYPDILDCEGERIYPEGPVRHHRMPDHRIEQIFDMQGDLGFSTVSGSGLTTNAGWYATSNILDFTNRTTGDYWQMNDSESTYKLYPLGLHLSNVAPPVEFRDQVVGYYIVRSDRSNNKTVIDKGFINVCDTSITERPWSGSTIWGLEALDEFTALNDNKVYTNDVFLSPNHKPGTAPSYFTNPPTPIDSWGGFWPVPPTGTGNKIPTHTWWNILEIHTPKSSFNDPLALGGDYIKLEATVYGDMFFDSGRVIDGAGGNLQEDSYVEVWDDASVGDLTKRRWKGGMSVVLNRHKYPRVQSPIDREEWTFIYNIPLSGLAYVGYDDSITTNILGQNSTTIHNEEYQQRTLVARYGQSCTAVAPTAPGDSNTILNAASDQGIAGVGISRSVCDLQFPFYYDSYKTDILHDLSFSNYVGSSYLKDLDKFMLNAAPRHPAGTAYGDVQGWAHIASVTDSYAWSVPNSPYMYYASVKSATTPYEDFDSINYIKMHSYLIPFDEVSNPLGSPQTFPVTGGDTFINRFQFEKGRWAINDDTRINNPAENISTKFVTSMTVGYVESEINTQFRHLKEGDFFKTFPYDTRNTYYEFLRQANIVGASAGSRDEMDDYMSAQEIIYRYKIDYSVVNNDVPNFQLPSTFDFCSECSESFPNTLLYSEISLDSQVQDFYKTFLINSTKPIPSYTGSIQNLFVKNSDLYIHTENNLWKISVAPQQLSTNTDVVEVGQAGFLERDPIKLFNNDDAFSRGGIIDKFSAIFGTNGEYIWLDRDSGRIFSLGNEGAKSISDNGIKRWLINHIDVTLDDQFNSLTGLDYPYKGTACNLNVGYKAVLDPEHDRYIITKKDYRLLDTVMTDMIELTTNAPGTLYSPATVIGQHYYDNDGFYIGIAVGTDVTLKDTLVESLNYNDETVAENKSWTLSYSLKDQSWVSWHSYIPNWMYNDSFTFYSFVDNSANNINLSIWEHNYGPFQSYYGDKFDFILDYVYKKNPYQDKTFDSIEYTSNVWLEDISTNQWIDVPFVTFDRFYVYNNNQISNLKTLSVGNLVPYSNLPYTVGDATAHKTKNIWKVNRLRDMAIDRFTLSESLLSEDWNEVTYQSQYDQGFGYIDHVINPNAIDLDKNVYTIQRLTDKYLGVRLFFNPEQDYKMTFNLLSGEKRIKI